MKVRKKRADKNPIQVEPEKKERPRLKKAAAWIASILFLLVIGIMLFSTIIPAPDNALLKVPGDAVAGVVAPVQNLFSTATEAVVNYLRTLKLRSNLEYEYNRVVAENVQLIYNAMLVDELKTKLAAYENLYDEMSINQAMNPVMCTVIGRDTNNYFSVFDINKGSNDGIEDYMAVTMSGALVGYTYSVTANSSKVLAIIDSQASIAGLIQSSRDHGMVRGTLGEDGQPMCRMFYLPNNLPRPGDTVVTSGVGMSFPKGIPIGTVRESTRGMDANKQYIVVEPIADFQHIEYVIVLRYKPSAEAVEKRADTSTVGEYTPLDSPRPYPNLQVGDTVITFYTPTPSPTPGDTAGPAATPTPTPPPGQTNAPGSDLEYHVPGSGANGTATPPSATPTPTVMPTPTFSVDQLTVEGDE